MDDDVVSGYLNASVVRLCRRLWRPGKPLPATVGRMIVDAAQAAAERGNARIRKDLLRVDDQLNDMLAFTGRPE